MDSLVVQFEDVLQKDSDAIIVKKKSYVDETTKEKIMYD